MFPSKNGRLISPVFKVNFLFFMTMEIFKNWGTPELHDSLKKTYVL